MQYVIFMLYDWLPYRKIPQSDEMNLEGEQTKVWAG